MLLAPNLYTVHKGQANTLGPSPQVWGKMLARLSSPDGCGGGRVLLHGPEDVGDAAPSATTSTGTIGGVGHFASDGVTIGALATEVNVARMASPATDGSEAYLATDGNSGAVVDPTSEGMYAFETRIRFSAITTIMALAGLRKPTLAADAITEATEELIDTDYVGFMFRSGEANPLQIAYKRTGVAAVYVPLTDTTVAVDTWIKLGFVYDRSAQFEDRIVFYVNNRRVGSLSHSVVTGAAFPNAPLAGVVGTLRSTATAHNVDVSFFGAGQAPVNHG